MRSRTSGARAAQLIGGVDLALEDRELDTRPVAVNSRSLVSMLS
jgi:hypothetical protein